MSADPGHQAARPGDQGDQADPPPSRRPEAPARAEPARAEPARAESLHRVTVTFQEPPDRVFGALEDPRSFVYLVLGSRRVRRFDPRWPERATRVHHSVGVFPFLLRDRTEVAEVDPPRHLVLDAHIGPLGTLRIEFRLHAVAGGTTLEIAEWPIGGAVAGARVQRGVETVVALRNRAMGRRLQRLVARREEQRTMAAVGVAEQGE